MYLAKSAFAVNQFGEAHSLLITYLQLHVDHCGYEFLLLENDACSLDT